MTENFYNLLTILSLSISIIIGFVLWKKYTSRKWSTNEKYLQNIPYFKEVKWEEKILGLNGSHETHIIFIKKINDFKIFKITIDNHTGDFGFPKIESNEIKYKEKIEEKKQLLFMSKGNFGFMKLNK